MMRLPALQTRLLWVLVLTLSGSAAVWADGISIGRVYDPYVQPLERELEYRLQHRQGLADEDDHWRHSLAAGASLNDRWLAEIYLLAEDYPSEPVEWSGAEVELKWQLSEQGEFNNDWGVLFEVEADRNYHSRAASTTLLVLHEWSRWIGTANLAVEYEWGRAVENEWETEFAGQLRYRLRRSLEPSLEFYWSQDTLALGPVLSGAQRLGGRRQLFWEFGLIAGLDSDTPDQTWKLALEYEF